MASPIQAIAFSPDGAAIVCGALNGEIRIFKTENGQRIAQIQANHGPIFALAFTADGKQIAAGGYDGHIRLYEATRGEMVKEFDSVPVRRE